MNAIHFFLPVLSGFCIYVVLAHWIAHRRLGFSGEVIGRAPFMFIWDVMAIFCGLSVMLFAMHEFTGHTLLRYASAPSNSLETGFVSAVCFGALFLIMRFNAADRFFKPDVAGIREGAIRTLLTLRIIDRTEEIVQKAITRSRM